MPALWNKLWSFCCSRATFGAENSGFFEIYGVSAHGEGVWASADILQTRREGINSSRFCADVFYLL